MHTHTCMHTHLVGEADPHHECLALTHSAVASRRSCGGAERRLALIPATAGASAERAAAHWVRKPRRACLLVVEALAICLHPELVRVHQLTGRRRCGGGRLHARLEADAVELELLAEPLRDAAHRVRQVAARCPPQRLPKLGFTAALGGDLQAAAVGLLHLAEGVNGELERAERPFHPHERRRAEGREAVSARSVSEAIHTAFRRQRLEGHDRALWEGLDLDGDRRRHLDGQLSNARHEAHRAQPEAGSLSSRERGRQHIAYAKKKGQPPFSSRPGLAVLVGCNCCCCCCCLVGGLLSVSKEIASSSLAGVAPLGRHLLASHTLVAAALLGRL